MAEYVPAEEFQRRQRIESTTHDSEVHFRRLLEKLPAGAYTCDAEGLITYFNQHAVRLWGRTPKLNDPVDRFCGSFRLYATDGTPITHDKCWMARALNDDKEYNGSEIIIERQNGERITALAHANPIHDESDRLIGAVNVLVDISERKQAEEARRKLEAQMQHTQKLESLGVMAGGIAHDFNNLLTSMMGYASLALMELPIGSNAAAMLEEIELAAQRAAGLARQMLAYSGRGAFVTEIVRLDKLVQEMATLLGTIVSKKATVQLNLTPVAIEGDATQISQIVMNLLTNASEALEGHGGVIGVRTALRHLDAQFLESSFFPDALRPGSYALVEVEDNGSGMTPETLARIFDPFFTTRFTGRGLGLAAVLGIVKGHHGTIRVTSTPGDGTLFQVVLPQVELPPDPQPRVCPMALQYDDDATILVVEDEEIVRTFVRQVLERAGFRVIQANDGVQGLAMFQQHRQQVGAVLLDLTMPGLDGTEVLQGLRALPSAVPVLVMSGYSEVEVAPQLVSLGAQGFLQKPFIPRDLVKQLRQVLQQPLTLATTS